MIRLLLTLLLALAATASQAQTRTPASGYAPFPCPRSTTGWTLQFPPPLTSVSYDSSTQLLYVVFNYTTAQAFVSVPVSVMQLFTSFQTQPPSTIYNSTVVPNYHQTLLSEKDNCVMQWEFGGNAYGPMLTNP